MDSKNRTLSIPLDRPQILIGKDESCDLVLANDAYISRRHAQVTQENDRVLINDQGSSNGTWLRIRRPVVLEPGDEVILGTSVLRLELHGR